MNIKFDSPDGIKAANLHLGQLVLSLSRIDFGIQFWKGFLDLLFSYF